MRRSLVPVGVLAVLVGMTPFSASAQEGADPAAVGSFGPVFQEPTGVECTEAQQQVERCKPAAMALSQLPTGDTFYWNGLEGMNDVSLNVVAEYGNSALNGQSRVMDLDAEGGPVWSVPNPFDGGANPDGNDDDNEYLPLIPHNNDAIDNDGDMFCADLNFLADGRVLSTGGTSYYQEPGLPGFPRFGVAELNGLKNTRIFDPQDQTWSQADDMEFGRWYPSMVTQPDGSQLTFSGVTKLIKPVYPGRPLDSLANERRVEQFDPETNTWTTLPDSANKSLPLFPRMHMLPNGRTFYNAAGQTFNPFGQAIDEALWNFASVFDPATGTWSDKGLPDFGGLPLGFRGSGFSVMMPLVPNEDGQYTEANFLSAGGVYGVSPGTYLATPTSTLTTIDTANGDAMDSRATGSLNTPRWYGSGTMLPTGEVFVSSGGDRDHVVVPGLESAIRTNEIYNPRTGEWTEVASQERERTYHNSATLLPDGRILVGGHAPIGTAYGAPTDLGQDLLGLSSPNGDPTFQIYSPPYLSWGERPVITSVDPDVHTDQVLDVAVDDPASITSVRALRNTTTTHLVDADQRNVEMRIVGRDADSVQVQVPGDTVLPPGPYMLFAHKGSEKGEIPSVSRQIFVDGTMPAVQIEELRAQQAEQAARELSGEDTGAQIPEGGTAPEAGPSNGGAPDGGPVPGLPLPEAPVPGEGDPLGDVLPENPLPLIGAVIGFGGLLGAGGHSVGRHRAKKRRRSAALLSDDDGRHRAA